MSKLIKYLSAFLLLVILAIGLLLIDDQLNPEVQERYESATKHKESEAFVYLLGIQAAADEDPISVGKNILKSIQIADKKLLGTGVTEQNYEYKKYPSNKKLSTFTLNSCSTNKLASDCHYIDKLMNHDFKITEMNRDQETLLDRFNIFLTKDDFHSITQPHLSTPLPHFQYIVQGNDLSNLKVISMFRNGEEKDAILLLTKNINLLRKQLEHADNLISKMIYVSILSKNIDVYSVLSKQKQLSLNNRMKALSANEKSLEKAMNYEFGFAYNTLKMISLNKESLSIDEEKMRNIPSWLMRLFYKPNITINNSAPIYKQVIELSNLNIEEYVEQLKLNKPHIVKKSYIRNYIGTVLNEVSTPSFNNYISRIHALDTKITLLNRTLNRQDDLEIIQNPFYQNKKNAYYTKNHESICFDIPNIRQEKNKCLRLKARF